MRLPREVINTFSNFPVFRRLLYKNFFDSLKRNRNVDDPRTWKTICMKGQEYST